LERREFRKRIGEYRLRCEKERMIRIQIAMSLNELHLWLYDSGVTVVREQKKYGVVVEYESSSRKAKTPKE